MFLAVAAVVLVVGGIVVGIGLIVNSGVEFVGEVGKHVGQFAEDAARRNGRMDGNQRQSQSSLKQIGLATHRFHDENAHFPVGGVFSADGAPLQSWQAQLLPFLNHDATFRRIDFQKPWTDAANADAYRQAVMQFQIARLNHAQTAVGYAASHYAGNMHVLPKGKSLRMADITDGTSNTILAGEVGKGIKAWGDPDNLRDPQLGLTGTPLSFGGVWDNGTSMLLTDGSVRFMNMNVSLKVIRDMSTPSGGEAVRGF
ncbi:MAG: DUF1559 domain-containing protein [Planctomycetota bacterium]|nr:DUF1559 domain-containing protein [Planctomycetota bacterium]